MRLRIHDYPVKIGTQTIKTIFGASVTLSDLCDSQLELHEVKYLL